MGLEEPDKRICKNTIDQGRKRSLQASKYSKTVYENLDDSWNPSSRSFEIFPDFPIPGVH